VAGAFASCNKKKAPKPAGAERWRPRCLGLLSGGRTFHVTPGSRRQAQRRDSQRREAVTDCVTGAAPARSSHRALTALWPSGRHGRQRQDPHPTQIGRAAGAADAAGSRAEHVPITPTTRIHRATDLVYRHWQGAPERPKRRTVRAVCSDRLASSDSERGGARAKMPGGRGVGSPTPSHLVVSLRSCVSSGVGRPIRRGTYALCVSRADSGTARWPCGWSLLFFCLNEFQVWTFSINEFHFNPTGWIHLWIVEY
jgi:hypothetical protein